MSPVRRGSALGNPVDSAESRGPARIKARPQGGGEVRKTNRRSGTGMYRLRGPEPGEKRGHAAEIKWSAVRFQPSAESPGRVSLVTFFARPKKVTRLRDGIPLS